jgi:predicted MFS family arabinose efflux permease
VIGGMAAISASYVGFALSRDLLGLTLLWVVGGAGWALSLPAKLALVARHINHDQASQEWGVADALNMSLIVVMMAIGAYIVSHFNYSLLFWLAAVINTAGIVPYIWYARLRR